MNRPLDRRVLMAGGILAAATLILAVTLVRAVSIDPLPASPDETLPAVSPGGDPVEGDAPGEQEEPAEPAAPKVPSEGPLDPAAIRLAVDHDPFQPDRRRAAPYRMPGEDEEVAEPEPPPPPPFRLLGTVAGEPNALALMQVEEAPPMIVARGESVLGYKLEQVEGRSAMLTGQGRTVFLTVSDPNPQPPQPRSARGARGARGNPPQRGGNETEEQAERVRERVQQAIEQLRARGAAPELIERMMQQLNRGGEVRFEEVRPGVILRGGDTIRVRRGGIQR